MGIMMIASSIICDVCKAEHNYDKSSDENPPVPEGWNVSYPEPDLDPVVLCPEHKNEIYVKRLPTVAVVPISNAAQVGWLGTTAKLLVNMEVLEKGT